MKGRTGLLALLMLGLTTGAFAQGTREVHVTDRAIVPVNTKVRFTTLIVLPVGDRILDFVCGDKDFWVVSGDEHLAYVKPAKEGASTNLNLVTASGRVYSFLLTEGNGEPDLKLYVVGDEADAGVMPGPRRFYAADEVESWRRVADEARAEVARARETASDRAAADVAAFKRDFPTRLEFPYRFRAHERPFRVAAIYHDGTFTYIRAQAAELPALYEWRDGQPSLVPFQVERGVYVVPRVLERGYLAIGKARLHFGQER
jgi:type IV secretion system protein VirB9